MRLEFEHIYKSFGETHVLRDVSFSAQSGRVLGLLGRNGAGKTTIIRILMDIFKADQGRVLLDGKPLLGQSVKIGYLPEERGLYLKLKVSEQMIYLGQLKGLSKARARESSLRLLKRLEADSYFDQKLETLSKGNQQKVQLAIALVHDPGVVALDEPFSGLDPVNAHLLKELILEQVSQDKIVVFSSHQMPYVEEFCQHICILNQGGLVLDGQLREIKKSYPRSRIRIVPERDAAGLAEKLASMRDWLREVKTTDDGEVWVTLHTEKDKQKLFQMVCGQGVDAISVMEPSLEEIFVEKAGGPIEAV
jgi:ABC-2 type transport system ATP-binding protein